MTTMGIASPNRIDLIGQRFGMLTVLADEGSRYSSTASSKQKVRFWKCICDCGATTSVRTGSLRSGTSRSCGCLIGATATKRSTKHGQSPRLNRTPEYIAWKALRKRCNNPSKADAKYYADRGISFCERWNDFSNFFEDMGQRPSPKHSIDRIDVNGNYEPSNCRWATPTEQSRNRRNVLAKGVAWSR